MLTEFDHARATTGAGWSPTSPTRGKDPFDALLDVVCADGLQTDFSIPATAEDWKARVGVWREGGALIGASDAGAHLDFVAYFDYPVVRPRERRAYPGVLPLEEAVH